jgi:hypothetical protein
VCGKWMIWKYVTPSCMISLALNVILRTWLYIFSLFFLCFLHHAWEEFLFNMCLHRFFFSPCLFWRKNLGRENHNLNGVLICGWMDVANFQCRSLAYEGGVYVILIMKAWRASRKGHNNLTKLNVTTSSICVRFSNVNNIWLWWEYIITKELVRLFFQVKHPKRFVRESKVHRIVPYLIDQPFIWTCFPNDIWSQATDICARNKEHASQSIENMYSNGASRYIEFDYLMKGIITHESWNGGDRIFQTMISLWMSEEVDSRYLPHTIFTVSFLALLDKDDIHGFG